MWVAVLFLVGVVLIFAEFLVPGGMLGVLGGISVIASMALGWYTMPEYGLIIFGGEFAGVVACIVLGLYLLSSTRLGGRLVLETTQEKSEGFSSPSQDAELVGKTATVQTALRPAGSIMLDNERIDAVSNGTFIDKGKTVEIVEVEGNRVVCEEVEQLV